MWQLLMIVFERRWTEDFKCRTAMTRMAAITVCSKNSQVSPAIDANGNLPTVPFKAPSPKCSIHYRNHQEPVDPHESVPCHHAWSTRCEAQLLLQLEKWESPQIDEIRAARLIMWKNDKSRLALFECQIKDAKESSCDNCLRTFELPWALPCSLWI